ncbi:MULTISPECIES: hypothetical protein [unclassified Hahella]|uniref:hypothetical protein n=1 Tax=unclassified Hahella TaxID=2624107 RepID=UPI001C1EC9A0|nr:MULTISPECIES: hypothetical protein [unclassified Hahella]MBU6953184.1 hypothetical protein [Hahella sp. HN01]MDG9671043.1 hypothetical protein [Hahella sp. CR1]
MPSIKIVKEFNQYCFESASSEQAIVLIKSRWDRWKSGDEFADACLEYAWGKRVMTPRDYGFYMRFVKDISASLREKLDISGQDRCKEFTLVCNDWNSKALMWKEQSLYFMLCWSTAA